jgi:hypothetical protein
LQVWPSGHSFTFRGDLHDKTGRRLRDGYRHEPDAQWREGTADEWRQIEIETLAEMYRDRDILACQSALVTDLIQHAFESRGDLAEGFQLDEIQNMRPDPSEWGLERCREYLNDHGIDEPTEGNVWKMDRADLVEQLENVGIECRDDESDETLREAVIANIDDETISGIEDWREAVRDNAEDEEVLEWWLVSSWLCDKLRDIGEVVIDNGYGHWWGRTCTGQQLIMDGTLQRIAAQFVNVS